MLSENDTIFALSSGGLPSGVAVVRLSGTNSFAALARLGISDLEARRLVLRRFLDPETLDILDHGMVCIFPSPNSFTGEDCAELHIHGGKAVVARFLEVLGGIDGLRMASAGEFSRRAFENGKLDLTEIEGLSDLIASETELQRRQAVAQAGGIFRGILEKWRADLIRCRAFLEAEFDFSDEEDVPDSMRDFVSGVAMELRQELSSHLDGVSKGEIIREGFRVALLGAPNSGKSSLLNALAGRDIAIVSSIAGTTRDVIECKLDIGGMPVLIFDTAGIRNTDDIIEQEGIRRAKDAAEAADLVLWLKPCNDLDIDVFGLPDNARLVYSKSDITCGPLDALSFNVVEPNGLDDLLCFLESQVQDVSDQTSVGLITRERHRLELNTVLQSLTKFSTLIDSNPVLASEELRLAGNALGRLSGMIDVEDLLDVIFSQFCIGK